MEAPTEEAIKLNKEGNQKEDIAKTLEGKGFNQQQVSDAMNHADIKAGVEGSYPQKDVSHPGMRPSVLNLDSEAPSPMDAPAPPETMQSTQPQFQPSNVQPQDVSADTEELVESIVEEKWQEYMERIGDIESWKIRTEDDVNSIKQEIIRLGNRFDQLQNSVVEKVSDYNRSVEDVGSEIKALEKVFKNILDPFTTNIKELNKITKELKGK